MLRKLTASLMLLAALGAAAVTRTNASSQYKAYPDSVLPALTAAPEGYKPFHIEHYGRHGSRWLIEAKNYDVPVNELAKAERAGALTPDGQRVLDVLRRVQADSRGRLGELTELGAAQHRRIGTRMGRNFPEVFADGAHVDARSTVVIRCILSMLNEIEALSALYPQLQYTTDASEADMYYMNFHEAPKFRYVDSVKAAILPEFDARRVSDRQWLRRLVNDEKLIADSINVPELEAQLYEVALNMPSHAGKYPDLLWVFSDEDVQKGWERNNIHWFLNGANSALTAGKGAMTQRNLLRNIIASADSALTSPRTSANLRFGHETMVLSLGVLLDLGEWGREINDLDSVAALWQGYDLFPMGCNIQMVFYRPEGSVNPEDVLVKILLNEREMPVKFATPVSGPYYRWSELRDTLLRRLDDFEKTL